MAERLKDMFFTHDTIQAMANALRQHYDRFKSKEFLSLVLDDTFEAKELKERMRHTTLALHDVLPKSYSKAVSVLMKAAPEVKGFEAMCLPDYVEVYGHEEWDLSLKALAVFTQYSSSEFAIRPFLQKDPKQGMTYMLKLASHKEANVRRFASEGCRPRLPWAMALPNFKKDPSLILPVLEKLKADDSEFVRKSVANNLNDISKDNPKVVLDLCKQWQGTSPHTDWIIKRACRTLLKEGNTQALRLFGFGDPKKIDIEEFKLNKKKLTIGDDLQFSFHVNVNTKRPTKVRLEYRVTYAKAKGKTSQKVFQIKEDNLKPGQHTIKRKQSFANMSTRKHYAGEHAIAIIVNGVEKTTKPFHLNA